MLQLTSELDKTRKKANLNVIIGGRKKLYFPVLCSKSPQLI